MSDYSLGVRTDGTLAAWGNGCYDLAAVSDYTNVVSVDLARQSAIFLRADGTPRVIQCYGNVREDAIPAGAQRNVVAVSGGMHSSTEMYAALKGDGRVVVWWGPNSW